MVKISKENKKTINRNPFNEKLIHRYYLESLYFFENIIDKSSLIPFFDNQKIKFNNLALVVPEDSRKTGYRPDFTLYFKNYSKEVPVEVKWKSSEFNKKNQINYIKNNGGFLVVLEKDSNVDVPIVVINPIDFQEWMAKRIYTLTRDSLNSKNVGTPNKNNWIVALRGPKPLVNFKRMMDATNQNFWAFKNSKYVTNQIFNLQKNDSMIFLFFKSPNTGMAMTPGQNNKIIEIFGWAEVTIIEPYYICLKGEQAEFFEKIRKTNNQIISVADRKWVHFIDFKINEYKDNILLSRNRGQLDSYIVSSSNQGGALTSVPQNIYEELISYIKTQKN
jgi:hypothetical protein